MSSDDSLLVLILDLNPLGWNSRCPQPNQKLEGIQLTEFLDQILIFMNCFLSLSSKNELSVIVSHPSLCKVVYPTPREANLWDCLVSAMKQISQTKIDQSNSSSSSSSSSESGESKLTAALSLALCYMNGKLKSNHGLARVLSEETDKNSSSRQGKKQARILVTNISQDRSIKYISFMNCVFSAQKLNVQIDCCNLLGTESSFFQQSANITSGTYYLVPLEKQSGLLQYLIHIFLVDRVSGNYLKTPSRDKIDFRPACFCHRTPIDIGKVCSVCLSVFCDKPKASSSSSSSSSSGPIVLSRQDKTKAVLGERMRVCLTCGALFDS